MLVRILAVVPAYNEEACIASTITELCQAAPQVDYIVINDGSAAAHWISVKSVDLTTSICQLTEVFPQALELVCATPKNMVMTLWCSLTPMASTGPSTLLLWLKQW